MSAVYFMQSEKTGAIKIGITRWLEQRLSAIRVASPEPVSLLGAVAGDSKLERALHAEFMEHRIKGEWFKPVPALLEKISSLINSLPAPSFNPTPPARDEFTPKAASWLRVIEEGEARRLGCRTQDIRGDLATRLGLHPGYIENLQRNRIKHPISAQSFFAIREEYLAELERQIAEANEMISLASAETQLAKARSLLLEKVK